MKEVFSALKHMQHENRSFHESIAHLQGNQTLVTFGSTSKEP
jgi:predicted CopG family antitoxin